MVRSECTKNNIENSKLLVFSNFVETSKKVFNLLTLLFDPPPFLSILRDLYIFFCDCAIKCTFYRKATWSPTDYHSVARFYTGDLWKMPIVLAVTAVVVQIIIPFCSCLLLFFFLISCFVSKFSFSKFSVFWIFTFLIKGVKAI